MLLQVLITLRRSEAERRQVNEEHGEWEKEAEHKVAGTLRFRFRVLGF